MTGQPYRDKYPYGWLVLVTLAGLAAVGYTGIIYH